MCAGEEIPAFSIWKMFNAIISRLISLNRSKSNFEHLDKIIKLKDFSNFFVFPRDPDKSNQQYETIANKYKSFTVWLLGRFFYLLSVDQPHKVITEIQICVMNQLSLSQLHVYHEMSEQYSQALYEITKFVKSGSKSLTLNVFIPEKHADLAEIIDFDPIPVEINENNCYTFVAKMLPLIKQTLDRAFLMQCFHEPTRANLDNLLCLLCVGPIGLKLEILRVFLDLRDTKDLFIQRTLSTYKATFEQFICQVFDSKLKLSANEMRNLEQLTVNFLSNLTASDESFLRISRVVIETARLDQQPKPGNHLLQLCKNKRTTPLPGNREFKSFLVQCLVDFDTASLCGIFDEFKREIGKLASKYEGQLPLDARPDGNWTDFWCELEKRLEVYKCPIDCHMADMSQFMTKLLTGMCDVKFSHKDSTVDMLPNSFFIKTLSALNSHYDRCDTRLDLASLLEFLYRFGLDGDLFVAVFEILSSVFTQTPPRLGFRLEAVQRKIIVDFTRHLVRSEPDKVIVFKYLSKFVVLATSGILQNDVDNVRQVYLNICKNIMAEKDGNEQLKSLVIASVPLVLSMYNNPDQVLSDLLTPALSCSSNEIRITLADTFAKLICIASSSYWKTVQVNFEESSIDVQLFCDECVSCLPNDIYKAHFPQLELGDVLSAVILNHVMTYLSLDDNNLKIKTLKALPVMARHLKRFHSNGIWSEICSERDDKVRMTYVNVVPKVLTYANDECLDGFFATLEQLYKKSLLDLDYAMQSTILLLVDDLSRLAQLNGRGLDLLKLLVHFIMLPLSKYSSVAMSQFYTLAECQGTTTYELYKYHRRELSSQIASLCMNCMILNQNSPNLEMCLSKVVSTLGQSTVKVYLSNECQYLLPHFVAKVSTDPTVALLIEQCASILNVPLGDLLASCYGHTFVQVFLNMDRDSFKRCMNYVEKTSELSGAVLRKRSFWVLLNELLVFFHPKRAKVLLAFNIMAREEGENRATVDIPAYLRPRLLGILQKFDFKLMERNTSQKETIVRSLAEFLVYMGKENVTGVRFKVIATLRTADCDPHLQAFVWEAFIKTCDIVTLGPHLATIFVSLTPLLTSCPETINDIFRYLLIEHETTLRDNIVDLFFVSNDAIDVEVLNVIRKYTATGDNGSLRDKIGAMMKYLQHETSEVQVGCLKQLKALLHSNREELDRMILGYNGIDGVVVALIDALMVGCGQSDRSVKLACGEVVGVLGAVEPSHLPRRYAERTGTFAFFMDDDGFVVATLSELLKALQAEKNTVDMDKFSVAVQKYLQIYDISPTGSRSDLWNQFTEAQQEVLAPFQNSRYYIPPTDVIPTTNPIYGTAEGATCRLWLYNWISALVAALPENYRKLLQSCLPAMKKDQKIVMVFLSHVVLHSLKENSASCHREMEAVLDDWKQTIDENAEVGPYLNDTNSHTIDENTVKRTQCTKVVFTILDFLDRWMREWRMVKGLDGLYDTNYVAVKIYVKKFSKLLLSQYSYRCADYPRALRYLEDHLTTPTADQSQYRLLSEIYARLEDPDGVAGVTALQPHAPSLWQRILLAEVTGKLSDAVSLYERLTPPLKANHVRGLVQCHLDLDNVTTALSCAADLFDAQAEPLWRLGRYDDLDVLLKKAEVGSAHSSWQYSWGCQVGKVLLALNQHDDRQSFRDIINKVTLRQVECLADGTYHNSYVYVTRLHILEELRQTESAICDMALKSNDEAHVRKTIEELAKEWELRIKIVQESVKVLEQVLCVRRAALGRAKRGIGASGGGDAIDALLGDCWLTSAKTARAAGVYQQAFTYGIKAEEYSPPRLFIEKAELHWIREEHEHALRTLKRGLARLMPQNGDSAATLPLETRKICAEAKLLVASYNDAISNVHNEVNVVNYKEALRVYKESEKSFVCLAQFYDRLLQSCPEDERDTKQAEQQIQIITFYGRSLFYGTTYVYQSLPRLLSIWFDFGTRSLEVTNSTQKETRKTNLLKMTQLIDTFSKQLPAYIFLTALSQLISRICHPINEVHGEIKSILVKLLLHFPQQTLWMLISVIRSSYPVRAKRCADILTDDRLKEAHMAKLIRDFTTVAEKLTELCNKDVSNAVDTVTVSSLVRVLPRLLSKGDLSEIMIPTHKFRKLVLPNPDFSSTQHDPFPNKFVHIVGIEEEMTILHSLQKPRKITFRGSDGKKYVQMLKPKDDLRKDFRLMEFNDIVNQLLLKEPEARQRRLNIRLYSVAPLNEECGLIEWIPNLVGLRPAILKIYSQMGIGMRSKELKDVACAVRDPLSKKMDVFQNILLPKHPPVLGEWFRSTFPDAQSWMFARQSYVRTTAVMSMVGYILGLGDRHGENISMDSTNGDTVHVDFNCLFNKGESFEWPERVPFRLTQNMVAAMGPLGVEGPFRKSCACSLKVLRDNTKTLMSIVTPFVYDPLVSWTKVGASRSVNAERTNDQALEHVKNIELRLQGIVKTKARANSIPLSVDGQTDFLINEAISMENLCQMYIGWGPFF